MANREIKFRAWDIVKKEMYPSIRVGLNDNIITIWDYDNSDNWVVQNGGCEVMQYTGLKDKNGKEIYEGDIINPNSNNPRKIFWSDVFLQWYCEDFNGNTDPLEYLSRYEPIIIGNMLENPELLKEDKGGKEK